MSLTDSDYNTFASTLANRISNRLRGLDTSAARIVSNRPQDHVLSGFLTPTGRPPATGETPEEVLADDLPRDSPYQQTNIGAEWLAPDNEASGELLVSVAGTVYVRRVPTFEEQNERGVWRTVVDPVLGPRRLTELVPVWTRESIGPIEKTVPLRELVTKGRAQLDLSPDLQPFLDLIALSGLFSGRRPIRLQPEQVASADAYTQFLAPQNADRIALAWRLMLDVRRLPYPAQSGLVRIAARIVNQTDAVPGASLDYVDPNVYAIAFSVRIPRAAHRPTLFQELPASFRFNREMPGVGINGQIDANAAADTLTLSVETVPIKSVPRLEPREIEGAEPTFNSLAEDAPAVLRQIRDEMLRYDRQSWATKIALLTGQEQREAGEARDQFAREVERFSAGIALLEDTSYPLVRRAFELMNLAMDAASRKFTAWRLFQIVFIVSQLSELAAREYPELATTDDGSVEVLWFAAGGGKTEAFLGLILWQAFFDRLRGKRLGVTAFVRFPLRLLTFQQLQRLSRSLASAEIIRAREGLAGERFSIGYFVGNSVTPNSISDDDHRRFQSQGIDARLQRLFACPFCSAKVKVRYEPSLRLIEHRCTSPDCPGGAERLPVYVVDADLYSQLPTVIVSTVDKLAQFGQNQRFANLFGRIDAVCGSHGATFRGTNRLCEAARQIAAGARPENCGQSEVDYGPFHDPAPALLVQDELHLLSEELGTFDAHYETAVMRLSQSLGAKPWKIITATATIEEYRQHAWHLYLKKARQFPGPGPEAYDSFYYRQNQSRLGRIFIGVLGVGRKHTPAVTKALTTVYLELQAARDLAAVDLARATTTYTGREMSEQEFRTLVFLYEMALTYVLTRKGSDQVAEAIESRVKKEIQETAPRHGELKTDMFNGGVDVAEMIAVMEAIANGTGENDPAERVRGLVTTNIIGHGVDVDRFNVILFAGFTRLVAEYIQASARVGRTYPGLSLLVVTPQSERDRSIFDRFSKFHEYLDRLVDPSPVNRWPEPALFRTVPGVLCGYLMGVAAAMVGAQMPTVESVQDRIGQRGAEALNEDAVVEWMLRAYGADLAPTRQYGDRVSIRSKNAFSAVVNTPRTAGRPQPLNTYLKAMRSLRDVDDPASVNVSDDEDVRILRVLMNG